MSPAQLSFVIGVAVLLLLLGRALLNPVRPPLDKSDPSSLEQRGRRHATYVSLIHQALLPADLNFLAVRGPAKLAVRVRRERRRVALLYLTQVREDFDRLLHLSRIVARLSPEVAAAQELERFGLSLQFWWRYQMTRLGLRFGWSALPQLGGLSQMVSELAVRMEVAMKELGERAALAAKLASSLDRRGMHLT